jgi:hypothetical protein
MINVKLFPELFEDIELDELVSYTANELDDVDFQGIYTANELEAGEHYTAARHAILVDWSKTRLVHVIDSFKAQQ